MPGNTTSITAASPAGERRESAAHDGDRPPAPPTGEDDRHDDPEQEHEGERARRERQCGAGERERAATALQRGDRGEQQRDPEHVRVETRQQRQRRGGREGPRGPARVTPPLARRDRGEQRTRSGCAGDDEHRQADHGGEHGSEQAVGDEGIGARVPVVVPEQHAVADQGRAIRVCGEILGRRSEEEHGNRARRADETPISGSRPMRGAGREMRITEHRPTHCLRAVGSLTAT